MRTLIFTVAVVLGASLGWGQQHTMPGATPQAGGYDPYQLNWQTGRFVYAPVPYDASQGPYRFNWYSGRWDYLPVPAPQSVGEIVNESRSKPVAAVAPVNTQAPVSSGKLPSGAVPVDNAVPAAVAIQPDVSQQPGPQLTVIRRETKEKKNESLSTRPSTEKKTMGLKDPLDLSPTVGQWIYDYNTGRWMHVLPPG
jgi:hypothetical protein